MTTIAVEFLPVTIDSIKRLAKVEGACVSIYLPAFQQGAAGCPRSDTLLRSYTNLAAEQLRTRGLSPTDLDDLLEPLRTFQATDERLQRGHSTALAVFRAAGFCEVYALPAELSEGTGKLFVEASFQILPLLEYLSTPRDFYLLALTRKGVRLLHNGQMVPLPASIPATLEEFLALEPPDHRLDNRTAVGPSLGKMKRVPFGTGSELESGNRHFRDYCVTVDRGLVAMFETMQRPPLVLAGAISEVSIYRKVNTYTRLCEQAVAGSPDAGMLSDAELTRTAAHILADNPSPAEIRANAHVFGALGSARVVTELTALVRAASRGKVGEVFIASGLSAFGDVDHITGKVRVSGDVVASEDDLYNAAAVETLNHSGEVFVVPPERIPGGFGAVAALRY
jgi:hypothetical protein